MSRFTIILDPGHGGINPATGQYVTPGKRSLPDSVDGSVFYEGVNNREHAKVWAETLRAQGYKVLFTVEPSDWRDVDLNKRTSNINQLAKMHNVLVISIHSNASNGFDPKPAGHEIWTAPGESKSDTLASCWIAEFKKEFPQIQHRKGTGKTPDDKEGHLAICTQTTPPAVLIELDFFTNPASRKMMESKDYQKRTANVLVRALKKFEA